MFPFASLWKLIRETVYGRNIVQSHAPTVLVSWSPSDASSIPDDSKSCDSEDTHDSEVHDHSHKNETRPEAQEHPTEIFSPNDTDSRCVALLRTPDLSPYDQAICQMILAMGRTHRAEQHASEALDLLTNMAEKDPLDAPLAGIVKFSETYHARLKRLDCGRRLLVEDKGEGAGGGKYDEYAFVIGARFFDLGHGK